MATTIVKAKARWVEGLQFVGTPPSGHAVPLDGAREGGGADSAVHPRELLLLGLAGCTGMDVISILKKMRVEVSGFEVRLEAEAAQEHPRAFRKIRITYCVAGPEVPADKLQHAIELSQNKYCAVAATLKAGVELVHDYEIHQSG